MKTPTYMENERREMEQNEILKNELVKNGISIITGIAARKREIERESDMESNSTMETEVPSLTQVAAWVEELRRAADWGRDNSMQLQSRLGHVMRSEDRGATPTDISDPDSVVEKDLAGLAHDLRDIVNEIIVTNQNNDKILRLADRIAHYLEL